MVGRETFRRAECGRYHRIVRASCRAFECTEEESFALAAVVRAGQAAGSTFGVSQVVTAAKVDL